MSAGEGLATRQNLYVAPPTCGGVVCVTMTTSVVVIDLTSMAGWPGNQVNGPEQGPAGQNQNPVEHFISLQADGTDGYFAFCATIAEANSLSTSATTSISNNKLATNNTAFGTVKLPQGQAPQRYRIPAGQSPAGTPYGSASMCRYLGIMTSTLSGQLRMWQSSP